MLKKINLVSVLMLVPTFAMAQGNNPFLSSDAIMPSTSQAPEKEFVDEDEPQLDNIAIAAVMEGESVFVRRPNNVSLFIRDGGVIHSEGVEYSVKVVGYNVRFISPDGEVVFEGGVGSVLDRDADKVKERRR